MKKFFLLSIMLISLLLLWCGKKEINTEIQNEQTQNQNNIAEENTQNETDFSMSDCMKWCEMLWNKQTPKEQMITDCESLCEAWKAIEENDADACEKSEWIMKDSCYVSIASEKRDPKLCKSVTDGIMRSSCYSTIAEEAKDDSICENIEDSLFRNACIEAAKNSDSE